MMTWWEEVALVAYGLVRGHWRFCAKMIRGWCYGATHRRCRSCGQDKGRNHEPLCWRCQMRNITVGLMCDHCGCTPFIDCTGCGCQCHDHVREEA